MVMALVLACGWAVLVAEGSRAVLERAAASTRAHALGAPAPPAHRRAVPAAVRHHLLVRLAVDLRRRRAARRETDAYAQQLGPGIDLVAVAIGAGATPYQAIELAAQTVADPAGAALGRVVDHVRLGVPLPEALASVTRTAVPLRPLTEALATAYRLGSPLGDVLARLALDARANERRRAEARARTVPVRLLFPLVFCVLPAFAVLTVVPVLVAGWQQF